MSGKVAIAGTWDDVPHLSAEAKAEMLSAIPPYQRAARSQGVPDLGAGAVYPLAQEDYITDLMPEPAWPRAYGLDVGWKETAAVFIGFDPERNIAIAYDEYFGGMVPPAVHSVGIKAKGEWIPGACDPAAAGTSQTDGRCLFDVYAELGLDLTAADNAVTAGTTKVWNLLSTGQLKIQRRLVHLLRQLKIYRRDEKGVIVKRDDHGPDALRYGCMTGPEIMRTPPAAFTGLDKWLTRGFSGFSG